MVLKLMSEHDSYLLNSKINAMLVRQKTSSTHRMGGRTMDEGQSHLKTDSADSQDINRHAARPAAPLPNEILSLIFRECMRGETIHLPICYSCSTMTMPWVLGQVCSEWKGIIEDEPSLWSPLILSYEGIRDKEAFTRRVRDVIFPRIKLGSISLSCHANEWRRRGENPDVGSVIVTLVIPNLARFRYLSLGMIPVALQPLINSPPGSIALLESLDLLFLVDSFAHSPDFKVGPGSITVAQDAPNLREVYLRGIIPGILTGPNPLTLPWGQLTKLNISIRISYSAVIGFLPYCVQLLECALVVIGDPNESSTILLPVLQSLQLATYKSQVCEHLLGALIPPALRSVILHLQSRPTIAVPEMVLALIVRSGCILECFELTSPYAAPFGDGISALLEAMPHLRRLYTPSTVSLPIPVMRRMMTGELLPHLEAMHCDVESFPVLLDLLKIRRSGDSPGALPQYGGIRCALIGLSSTAGCNCNRNV